MKRGFGWNKDIDAQMSRARCCLPCAHLGYRNKPFLQLCPKRSMQLIQRGSQSQEKHRIVFVYVVQDFFLYFVQRIFSANFSSARTDPNPSLPHSTPATSCVPLLALSPAGTWIPFGTVERESSSSPQHSPGGQGTDIQQEQQGQMPYMQRLSGPALSLVSA